jgi:hypothetical protein
MPNREPAEARDFIDAIHLIRATADGVCLICRERILIDGTTSARQLQYIELDRKIFAAKM